MGTATRKNCGKLGGNCAAVTKAAAASRSNTSAQGTHRAPTSTRGGTSEKQLREKMCTTAGNCEKSKLRKIAENCGTSAPLCDIPSGCCSFTGPWTVTRSSLRMLRRVAAFCRPLRPVLPLVSFPRSRSPVVGVLGLCWMWHGVPFARQGRPIIGVLRMCWSFDCFCCPRASVHRPSVACLAVFPCA